MGALLWVVEAHPGYVTQVSEINIIFRPLDRLGNTDGPLDIDRQSETATGFGRNELLFEHECPFPRETAVPIQPYQDGGMSGKGL